MSVPMSSDAVLRAIEPQRDTPRHESVHGDELREHASSFARRRLWLGITGVGTSVVASLAWIGLLLTGVVTLATPTGLTALPQPIAMIVQAVGGVLAVFVAHALLTVVLEYRGGNVVVRTRPGVREWLRQWSRGVLVQGALLAGFAATAAIAAVVAGTLGVVMAALAGSIALLAAQGFVARAVASLRLSALDPVLESLALNQGVRGASVRVVDSPDEAFVGGWVGVQAPQLWIPARWTDEAHRELLTVQFARRQAQYASGARRRGVLRAALWPALGLALFAPLLPWTPDMAEFWLALPAVSTLWMFVGVLLLPSLSRPVVYNADSVAAARLGRDTVARAVRQLDAWQDDEAERSPGVEFVFHPVPSRGNRERALQRSTRRTLGGAHQLTRLTLYSALAAGSLLGRVVHCNIGRPSLWVLYPGD